MLDHNICGQESSILLLTNDNKQNANYVNLSQNAKSRKVVTFSKLMKVLIFFHKRSDSIEDKKVKCNNILICHPNFSI